MPTSQNKSIPAAEAIEQLLLGNARFASGLKSVETFISTTKSKDLAVHGQRPFCVILTCSDSRIPIELIFDRGMGDLFVIRTFGNVVDASVAASVEYALLNFNINLMLIMGHSRSGAIRATLETEGSDLTEVSPALRATIKKVRPSLKRARIQAGYFDPLVEHSEIQEGIFRNTCYQNVLNSKHELIKNSKIIQNMLSNKAFYLVPSLYEMDLGQVHFRLDRDLSTLVTPMTITMGANAYGKTALEIYENSLQESDDEGLPREYPRSAKRPFSR